MWLYIYRANYIRRWRAQFIRFIIRGIIDKYLIDKYLIEVLRVNNVIKQSFRFRNGVEEVALLDRMNTVYEGRGINKLVDHIDNGSYETPFVSNKNFKYGSNMDYLQICISLNKPWLILILFNLYSTKLNYMQCDNKGQICDAVKIFLSCFQK